MNWHCIELSPEDLKGGELELLRGTFYAAFISRNGPAGMALYGCWDVTGNRYQVFASPAAKRYLEAIFKTYSAKPLAPPKPIGEMDFICGDETGLNSLVA